MRITFTLTADDLIEMNAAISKASGRSGKIWQWFVFLALLVLALFGAIRWGPRSVKVFDPILLLAYGLGVIGLIAILALKITGKSLVRKQFKKERKLQSQIEADLDETGLAIRTETEVSEILWMGFVSFLETQGTLLLFLSPRSAHILPKRAFASEAELEAARSLIAAKISFVFPKTRPVGPPEP